MRVHNRSRKAILADKAQMTSMAASRGPSVIPDLPPGTGEALVIWASRARGGNGYCGCPRVDLLFVGSDGHILDCMRGVHPSRLVPTLGEAHLVIELPGGTLERSGTEVGDYIEFS